MRGLTFDEVLQIHHCTTHGHIVRRAAVVAANCADCQGKGGGGRRGRLSVLDWSHTRAPRGPHVLSTWLKTPQQTLIGSCVVADTGLTCEWWDAAALRTEPFVARLLLRPGLGLHDGIRALVLLQHLSLATSAVRGCRSVSLDAAAQHKRSLRFLLSAPSSCLEAAQLLYILL